MKIRLALVMLLGLPNTAFGHPHSSVDQQAMLSLGRTKAILTYAIVPSMIDGDHMFSHLDTNRNGRLDPTERSAFARNLLANTHLIVGGTPVRLTVAALDFPDLSTMSAGGGMIKVTAQASVRLLDDRKHNVALNISDHSFGAKWLLQAYYFPDLLSRHGLPILTRPPGSAAIAISIPRGS